MDVQNPNVNERKSSEVTGDPAESIPKAFSQAVDQVVHSLEPKIHETVNDLAERAVRFSNRAARDAAQKMRRNPWYMVGGVILLAIGLGLVFGMEERRDRRFADELH
ncbi:MAG: hypothetical protein NDI61_13820 [Bdellovibrionaceae bacterium]|nr:hypothetical protein [Pseudobdellovibrionaceae bacterium]